MITLWDHRALIKTITNIQRFVQNPGVLMLALQHRCSHVMLAFRRASSLTGEVQSSSGFGVWWVCLGLTAAGGCAEVPAAFCWKHDKNLKSALRRSMLTDGNVCLKTWAAERLTRLGLLHEGQEISSSHPALLRCVKVAHKPVKTNHWSVIQHTAFILCVKFGNRLCWFYWL